MTPKKNDENLTIAVKVVFINITNILHNFS